jgi:surface polysaccharide O-acyltransferase-like enzyme
MIKLPFFFKESITRFAVPMYFILSGMTFFRDYTNKKYISKLRARFFTLVIPYLIWNTLWLLVDIISSYTFIASFFPSRPLTVESILTSIFLAKWNLPFWFLSYLIIFVFISPIIDLIARNKYVGIAVAGLLSIATSFEFIIDIKIDAIVFYLVGAILGKHFFDFFTKKSSTSSQIGAVVFLVTYITSKNFFPDNDYFGKPSIKILIFILASYSMWSMIDLFIDKISQRPIYARSFPIFAMHINVSAVLCKLIYLILPKHEYFAIPNLIMTAVLTIVLINIFCIVFERYLPKTYALLMGKGIKKIKIKSGEN